MVEQHAQKEVTERQLSNCRGVWVITSSTFPLIAEQVQFQIPVDEITLPVHHH